MAENNLEESTGERLARFRDLAGLSQKALADKVGVSVGAISKWERDEQGIRGANLLKLAKALQVTVEQLTGVVEKDVSRETLGDDLETLIRELANASPAERRRLLYLLRALRQVIDRITGAHPSFSSWLRSTDTGQSGGGGPMRWRRYGTYSMLNFAGDGQSLLVDEVIRMEDMDEGLRSILRQLSIPNAETVEIPHTNKRDHKPYAQYYDNDLRELVAERYADDIRTYGYSFAGELVTA